MWRTLHFASFSQVEFDALAAEIADARVKGVTPPRTPDLLVDWL
eukprot:COSAG03_NODE_13179_length_513_cov_1.231884_1_plen_43_part_10